MTLQEPGTHHYRSSDGLELFYRDCPAESPTRADPVICLPGLTRNSLDFVFLASRLGRQRRVIMPDLRGRGQSQFAEDRTHYHPHQYARDIFDLMDKLGISRAAIVGTSLGGLIAMVMAAERPEAVSAVVLNDVGPEIDPTGLARILASAGLVPEVHGWEQAVETLKQHYGVVYPDWSDRRWLAFARTTYRESGAGKLDIQMDRNVGLAVREGVSGLREDPWLLFDALKGKPVLVLRGAISDILTPDILTRMKARKPDLEVTIVPGRGHAPFLDEPEAVDAIETFLDRH